MHFAVLDVDISHATFKKFGDTHNYPSLNVLDYEGLQKPMHKSSTEISIYQNLAFEPGAAFASAAPAAAITDADPAATAAANAISDALVVNVHDN